MNYLEASAVVSGCQLYRYELVRVWNVTHPGCVFLMLNPSTADGKKDDATVRKCVGFASRWGFGRVTVVNLFAYRATKPSDLFAAADPVGPDSDAYLAKNCKAAPLVVAAWGRNVSATQRPVIRERPARVLSALAGLPSLRCLSYTNEGHPGHPVMLSYALPLLEFPRPAAFTQERQNEPGPAT